MSSAPISAAARSDARRRRRRRARRPAARLRDPLALLPVRATPGSPRGRCAASCRQTSSPIPRLPPVTSATLTPPREPQHPRARRLRQRGGRDREHRVRMPGRGPHGLEAQQVLVEHRGTRVGGRRAGCRRSRSRSPRARSRRRGARRLVDRGLDQLLVRAVVAGHEREHRLLRGRPRASRATSRSRPSSQPTAAAASGAVRVESSSRWMSAGSPSSSSAARTRVRCGESVSAHRVWTLM